MPKAQPHGKSSADEKDSSAGKTDKPVEQDKESLLLPPHLRIKAPAIATASDVQALQRTIGNRALQRHLTRDKAGLAQMFLDEAAGEKDQKKRLDSGLLATWEILDGSLKTG